MTIVVNGEKREMDDGLTLERLLGRLDLPIARVAVERNRRVVPRARYPIEPVEPGDHYEIVTLVGGG